MGFYSPGHCACLGVPYLSHTDTISKTTSGALVARLSVATEPIALVSRRGFCICGIRRWGVGDLGINVGMEG